MTVRPYRTMLPPIWVATCADQRRTKAELRKTDAALGAIILEDVLGLAASSGIAHGLASGANGADGCGHRRVAARHEAGRVVAPPSLAPAGRDDHRPGSAGPGRRRADRSATCRRHTGAAGRVGRRRRAGTWGRSGRTSGRSAYQRRGRPWSGHEVAVRRRQLEAVHRRDRDDDVRLGRGELGDDSAGPCQRTRELVRRPDRRRGPPMPRTATPSIVT